MAVLVGKKAPSFSADAVINGGEFVENFSLEQFKGKNVILFFYPLDFTFVCPTELHAFQARLADFESKNTVVVGCSIDSKFSHWAWLNTPKNKVCPANWKEGEDAMKADAKGVSDYLSNH